MRGDHGPGWAEIALRITAHSRESGGAILVVQTRRLVPVLIGLRMTGTGTKLSFADMTINVGFWIYRTPVRLRRPGKARLSLGRQALRGVPAYQAPERSSDGHSGHRRMIMEMPKTEPTATKRQVWNAGKTVGAKRALKPKQIWEIRFYLNQHRRLRDRALFDLAIDSKLRGCDLVQMKIRDLVSGGQIRTRAIVMQQKAGRPVQFKLLSDARASLLAWLERRCGSVDEYVFPSRVDRSGHLSTRQYARLVDEWVTGVGLMRSEYGTHSLRRTKASIIYRATGNLRAVQILLGHSKIENTVRYLGIDVEDALALAENTEI